MSNLRPKSHARKSTPRTDGKIAALHAELRALEERSNDLNIDLSDCHSLASSLETRLPAGRSVAKLVAIALAEGLSELVTRGQQLHDALERLALSDDAPAVGQ